MNPFSRKSDVSKATTMFVLVLGASIAMVYMDKLTGAEWCSLLQWCLPAFVGAEAARKFTKPEDPST